MINQRELEKELKAISALFAEGIERTSRLERKLAPVKGHASNKKHDPVQAAVDRRNRRILKRNL